MSHLQDDPELLRLVRRYVTPGRRYLKLGGPVTSMDGAKRAVFLRELGEAAAEITPRELGVLLDAGWRERKTAAWLIAVAGRTEFRGRLGELLLASEGPYAGLAYCVALATFGTAADADLLGAYLDRYLPRADLYYDQAPAIGALLHLDAKLGTDKAALYLIPGGLWQSWIDGPPGKGNYELDKYRQFIGQLCDLARESAGHCVTRDQ